MFRASEGGQSVRVIKIGGNELDQPSFMEDLSAALKELTSASVLVHGGGKAVSAWQRRVGLTPRYVNGLRVTDEETRELAVMTLAGLTNKTLVAALMRAGLPALGLCGADLGLVRVSPLPDLGWVGKPAEVDAGRLRRWIAEGVLPVIAPIGLGPDGLYNVNADQMAAAIAAALPADELVFLTDVPGVRVGEEIRPSLSAEEAEALIASGIIRDGMVPKVRSALEALEAGVRRVRITNLAGLRQGGTEIVGGK
ncbi:MAG: acetylglutamate kinase [Anaerolineae bacterium]|uniref:acetylglutamate kinase n=1 Tax=Thermoflexus sp. TaxID=1969742 RepID=UPI0029972AB0|nr:acetylglutamate kinase [Anaerolineae bacterium]